MKGLVGQSHCKPRRKGVLGNIGKQLWCWPHFLSEVFGYLLLAMMQNNTLKTMDKDLFLDSYTLFFYWYLRSLIDIQAFVFAVVLVSVFLNHKDTDFFHLQSQVLLLQERKRALDLFLIISMGVTKYLQVILRVNSHFCPHQDQH